MAGRAVTLSYIDFERKLPITFKQLWENNEYTDVTLATEDDSRIQVHKVILISSSHFFRNILSHNPHPNPLIYLKGVKMRDLECILQYIYKGSCEVLNENIEDFLRTCRDLLVDGLVSDQTAVNEDDSESGDCNEPEEIVNQGFIDLDIDSKDKDVYKENLLENSPTKLNILYLEPIPQIGDLNTILHTKEKTNF